MERVEESVVARGEGEGEMRGEVEHKGFLGQ